MLSCGWPASESPVNGVVPESTVPWFHATLPDGATSNRLTTNGALPSASTP